jgi:hypothetical protein
MLGPSSAQRKVLDRKDCPARLNPPVTTTATQLSHIGTLQPPTVALQPKISIMPPAAA